MGRVRSFAVWFMIAIVTLADAYLPMGVPGPSTRTVVDPIHRRRRKNPRARMNGEPEPACIMPVDRCERKCPYCQREFERGFNRFRHQLWCQGEPHSETSEAIRKMPFNRKELFTVPVLREEMYNGSFRSYRVEHAGDVTERTRDYNIPISQLFK